MELTTEIKASVLLQLLEFHMNEIHRCEESEKTWFEWASALLLATFAAVIALASSSEPLQHPIIIRGLATVLILVPTLISVWQILNASKGVKGSVEVIVRLEKLLCLYDGGYYDTKPLYAKEWSNLTQDVKKRNTPYLYVGIIAVMAACVIFAVWLLL